MPLCFIQCHGNSLGGTNLPVDLSSVVKSNICHKLQFRNLVFILFILRKSSLVDNIVVADVTFGIFFTGTRNIACLAKVKIMKKSEKWETMEIPQR